ncbi:MOV10 [Bugula neritina]|uniref:RNA helicase n=1 Tax=Bugula neritina TaxID=10212 RepID=A0A7J7J2N7_BUGNE|nr:MOV10 [Bugula neritina]
MVCPYTCDVCDLRFSDYPSMLEHVKERRHIFRKKKSEYIASRPKLLGSASGVKVSFVNDALESDAVLHLSGEVDQSQSLKVVVTNTYNSSSLKINSCAKIESLSSVAIEMQDHLQGVILNPKERHEIEMSVKSDHIGRFRIPLELSFSRAQSFRLLREILYQCVSDQQLFEELKPNRPYLKPKVKLPDFHHFIPSDSQPDIKKNYALERVINLENYSIPNYIYQSIDVACHAPGNDRIEVLLNKLKLQSLTFDNYSCIFNKLLYFEEIQMWDDVAHYAMYDVQLRKSSRERFFQLNVYKEFPNSKILACASQNAAADLLIKRLLDHIPKDEILRLNALSRPYGEVDPQVKSVSNYRAVCSQELSDLCKDGDMIAEYPSRNTLMRKRVIVSTLVTSGRLVSADMRSHFTHIFIDEAGQATEPEAVIPISGLLDIKIGQLVLVGDPQQLGPVIRSPIASKARLGISLLERLMSYDIYQRDARSGHFNQNYVTKLVRSFRSHPDILEVPNSCFYENELQACANRMQREKFCNWEGLPSKNFPLIFHGVDGKEEQEDKSPSWFNRFEVMQVLSYAQDLLKCKSLKVTPDHIGIISPYHQQVKKITQALKTADSRNEGTCLNLAKIKVGSVERFQGDERDAIIISTVRSQESFLTHDRDFKIGFVGNPKRFNVAVTRAKALLIVIGNPAILRKDKNWFRLLMHIEEGGGYTGSPLPEDISADESCGYVSGYSNESGYGETNGILEHVEPEMSHNEREIS